MKDVIVKLNFTYDGETDLVRIHTPDEVSLDDVKKAIKETDAYLRNVDGEYMDSVYAESGCCSGTLMDELNTRYNWDWEFVVEDFCFAVD